MAARALRTSSGWILCSGSSSGRQRRGTEPVPSRWFGLIELLLVFGVILGLAGWQWWGWWKWRKAQKRAQIERGDQDE